MYQQPQIYNLTQEQINNEELFQNQICLDMRNNYYWSDDWSVQFYKKLAYEGFISTTYETQSGLVLLPELQFDYAILDWDNLHISKKVKKLLKEDNYSLKFNTNFKQLISQFEIQHKDNWIKGKYINILEDLYINNQDKNFQLLSVELVCNKTGTLVAGEIGYKTGSIYTSLSGFSSKEKLHNNCGNLQLVLLSFYLEKNNFSFWNLGHPHMQYKKKLGAKIYTREEFLKRWREKR
ncbi:MAG: hypothetical protein U9R16_00350 [Campylobacterota bacterium]|nr:hypothetical protein [Campylobacterota bacterium]